MDAVFNLEHTEVFKKVAEEVLNNLYTSSKTSIPDIAQYAIDNAKAEIRKMIDESNFDLAEIPVLLRNKGYSEDKINNFVLVLEDKKSEILYQTLIHSSSSYGEAVTDFDWIVKLILGTSELKALKYPLLQLVLTTVNSNCKQKKRIYEINKDVLSKLIDALEEINVS